MWVQDKLSSRLISRFCSLKQVSHSEAFVALGQTGVQSSVFPDDLSAPPGSCIILLMACFSHSPTWSVMPPSQHHLYCWYIAMASHQPTSLRSFSSDRSHTLSHASYLRDSAMIDDTVVIPSQQVSKLLTWVHLEIEKRWQLRLC